MAKSRTVGMDLLSITKLRNHSKGLAVSALTQQLCASDTEHEKFT